MFDFGVLRDLRKREELTLEDVSARSGVSTSVISKLERNQTQAELETLYRLGRVFGLNTADVIALAESQTGNRATAEEYRSGEFTFQRVRFGNVTCYFGNAKAGARVSRPEIHGDDLEVCWVISGAVTITLPHEKHTLAAGDALQFDAILAHTYEAAEDCEMVVLHLGKGKRF